MWSQMNYWQLQAMLSYNASSGYFGSITSKGAFTLHNKTGLMHIQTGLIHLGRIRTESGLSADSNQLRDNCVGGNVMSH